jgi:hypothetical protein
MKIYGDIQSGNCYKVKLLLSFLDLPHEWVHVDIAGPGLAGDNANGQIRSDSAYFTVYSYHCAPTFFEVEEQPDGMEVAVLESRFRVDYDSDCRAFYLSEIAPRIESAQSDLAAINR